MSEALRSFTKIVKSLGSREGDVPIDPKDDWGVTSYAAGTNSNTNYGTNYSAPQSGYGYSPAPSQGGYAYPPQGGYAPTYGGYPNIPAPNGPNASAYGAGGGFAARTASTAPDAQTSTTPYSQGSGNPYDNFGQSSPASSAAGFPAYDASHTTGVHGGPDSTGGTQH
ncbi:hypothetical protein L486_06692 [Kwoniella mangroviensis CBS 10435]|uniref:Uncharacterized protein n=1 Tax=Kwoniella mangroviensis CBS 10435 TaxID=1331196 RepID=A0A1B9IK54_9TREE|nr:hypothetical protein L486_06692 [Kwoniella mangroviensis CBS 10435]